MKGLELEKCSLYQLYISITMSNPLELYASNGVVSVGMKVNSVKPIVYIAIGVVIGVLAVNYINNQKHLN